MALWSQFIVSFAWRQAQCGFQLDEITDDLVKLCWIYCSSSVGLRRLSDCLSAGEFSLGSTLQKFESMLNNWPFSIPFLHLLIYCSVVGWTERFLPENCLVNDQTLLSTSFELGAGGIKKIKALPSKSGNLTEKLKQR